MVYLPRLMFMVNVNKYIIHGPYGYGVNSRRFHGRRLERSAAEVHVQKRLAAMRLNMCIKSHPYSTCL